MKSNDILEKHIEKNICNYAKKHNWLSYKFTSPSCRSVPDRIFIKAGTIIFVEFKRKGAKPTEAQSHTISLLQDQKCKVFVIDNIEDGKKLIDEYS